MPADVRAVGILHPLGRRRKALGEGTRGRLVGADAASAMGIWALPLALGLAV